MTAQRDLFLGNSLLIKNITGNVQSPFFELWIPLFAFARIPCSLSEQSGDPACGAAGSFIHNRKFSIPKSPNSQFLTKDNRLPEDQGDGLSCCFGNSRINVGEGGYLT